jgi:glycosyltransferase involved in cell wall biosynthesis
LFVLASLPTIFTIHNNFEYFSVRNKALCIVAFILADQVTFVSHEAAKSFPDPLKEIKEEGWKVIQNGVDLKRVDSILGEASCGHDSASRTEICDLVTIGAMIDQKNQGFLLEVLKGLPPSFHLTIIGDGPLTEELSKKSRRLGIENQLHFAGLLRSSLKS